MPRKTTPKRAPVRPAKNPARKESLRAAAAVPAAQPIVAGAALQMIDRALLERWDANPRRVPDEARLDQLARSIAADGVLQNLVVRPHPKRKGHYQVITGNRRHAAHAIARSEYNPALSPELPCRIANLSDLEAQRLATVENVQRADMHPMDEAEAFARMLELGDNIENVAALTGLSVGTVKKRVALAVQLAPQVKTAFREGKLNLAVAQAFTIGSKDEQAKLLKRAARSENPHWVRSQLAQARVPVTYALFDVAAFEAAGGSIMRDLFAGENDADAYFDDAKAFRTAQARAIKDRLATLKAEWSWVEHKKGGYAYDYEYGWAKSKNRKLAGAVLHESESGEVKVFEGLVKPADTAKAQKAKTTKAARGRAAGDDTAEPAKLAGKGLMVACHQAKTAALQLGVAAAHEGPALRVPMACVVMALLRDGGHTYGDSEIKLRADMPTGDDRITVPPIANRLRDLLTPLDTQGLLDRDAIRDLLYGERAPNAPIDDGEDAASEESDEEIEAEECLRDAADRMAPAALFRALLTYQHLPALFATLVARHVGSWPGYRPELGSTPLACVIAERVTPGVPGVIDGAPAVWQLDAEWLKRYDRPGLVRLAKAVGIPQGDADRLKNHSKAAIVDAILKHPQRNPEAIPPELRFLTPAETEAALRELDVEAPAADAEPLQAAAE